MSGVSPDRVGCNVASRGASAGLIPMRQKPSEMSTLDRYTGPYRGLASWICCNSRCSARPNCMACLGASSAVSVLTPKWLQSEMVRGRRSLCGTTLSGLRRSSGSSDNSDAGRSVQCPFWIIATNSSARKSMCSLADLCGPRARAAVFWLADQGGVFICAGTPETLYSVRSSLDGCAKFSTLPRSLESRRCNSKNRFQSPAAFSKLAVACSTSNRSVSPGGLLVDAGVALDAPWARG